MSLLEFQRRMAADVMRPLTEDESMRIYLEDGSCMSDRAATYIKPNRQLTPFERLEIYNRQYWFRVLTALTEDYPALEAVVGAKHFEVLARCFSRRIPRAVSLSAISDRICPRGWRRTLSLPARGPNSPSM